jgi:hypothetical protein
VGWETLALSATCFDVGGDCFFILAISQLCYLHFTLALDWIIEFHSWNNLLSSKHHLEGHFILGSTGWQADLPRQDPSISSE